MGWTTKESQFHFWHRHGISFSSEASTLSLGPTQPPTQWVMGAFTLEVKQPGHLLLLLLLRIKAVLPLLHMPSLHGAYPRTDNMEKAHSPTCVWATL
jgi:hypothetical protein